MTILHEKVQVCERHLERKEAVVCYRWFWKGSKSSHRIGTGKRRKAEVDESMTCATSDGMHGETGISVETTVSRMGLCFRRGAVSSLCEMPIVEAQKSSVALPAYQKCGCFGNLDHSQIQLGGLGERCKLPQRESGAFLSPSTFLIHLVHFWTPKPQSSSNPKTPKNPKVAFGVLKTDKFQILFINWIVHAEVLKRIPNKYYAICLYKRPPTG